MSETSRSTVGVQVRRLALATIVLAPVVLAGLLAAFWLKSLIPRWVYWKMGLLFLIAVDVAYGVIAAIAILGTLVLGILLFERRRERTSRLTVARGLLLCVSVLMGLAVAEATSAVWQIQSHRDTAMPVGGLQPV